MTDRPRLLDLFCGAGGAAMGYHRAGFDVVGVDIKPQPHYPFEFHQMDAMTVLSGAGGETGPHPSDFDALHASPPCQAWTAYGRTGRVREHPKLLDTVFGYLAINFGRPWVVENVAGAPVPDAVTYCGSSFGAPIQRHRLFASNVALLVPPCIHAAYPPRYPASTNRRANSRRTLAIGQWSVPFDEQCRAMGIDWMTLDELSESIPPAYTEHIGRQLLAAIQAEQAA